MPRVLQGDIFATGRESDSELIVAFGAHGFNSFGTYWGEFASAVANANHIHRHFEPRSRQPYEYAPKLWFWWIETPNRDGMTETDVLDALDTAFSWAHKNCLTTVITNGIGDTPINGRTRQGNDDRASFLIDLCSDYENKYGLAITLVNLSDVFSRNFSPLTPRDGA